MKKRAFVLWVIIASLMVSFCSVSFAHSGRTDANGGHYDHSTGEYHYHHGYPAHQHPNGICPYDESPQETTRAVPKSTHKNYSNSTHNGYSSTDKSSNVQQSNTTSKNKVENHKFSIVEFLGYVIGIWLILAGLAPVFEALAPVMKFILGLFEAIWKSILDAVNRFWEFWNRY